MLCYVLCLLCLWYVVSSVCLSRVCYINYFVKNEILTLHLSLFHSSLYLQYWKSSLLLLIMKNRQVGTKFKVDKSNSWTKIIKIMLARTSFENSTSNSCSKFNSNHVVGYDLTFYPSELSLQILIYLHHCNNIFLKNEMK